MAILTSVSLVFYLFLGLRLGVESRGTVSCPCSSTKLCQPIVGSRKEIFIFSLSKDERIWQGYDWSRISTVVSVGNLDPKLMCLAHSHGARLVIIANIATEDLPDASKRREWIAKNLQTVKTNFLDGINVDFEDSIPQNRSDLRQGYTNLIKETREAFKEVNKNYQVTVDIPWIPNADVRYYDYKGLADASDFVFVMAYDEQSQIPVGPCVAKANSGFDKAQQGILDFLAMNISAEKMVLGIPWYGYQYKCLSLSQDNFCQIALVPFRGVNCSDAAGKEIPYRDIMKMLLSSTTGRLFDISVFAPYFNYKSNGTLYQIWYDDPESLAIKFQLLYKYNLRGAGMWQADHLDYLSKDPDVMKQTRDMWNTFPKYRK